MDLKKNDHLLPEIVKNLVKRLNTLKTNTNDYTMAVAQLSAIREFINETFDEKDIK